MCGSSSIALAEPLRFTVFFFGDFERSRGRRADSARQWGRAIGVASERFRRLVGSEIATIEGSCTDVAAVVSGAALLSGRGLEMPSMSSQEPDVAEVSFVSVVRLAESSESPFFSVSLERLRDGVVEESSMTGGSKRPPFESRFAAAQSDPVGLKATLDECPACAQTSEAFSELVAPEARATSSDSRMARCKVRIAVGDFPLAS